MDLELVALLQPDQQVAVARDERTLGDDTERQSFAARQALQHRPCDAETALGGLIRVGRRPDDDAFADRYAPEIDLERPDHVLLDEDALLERLPTVGPAVVRELGVGQLAGVMRALDDVAMRVARVAIAATELTSDVRIQRPVIHPRCGGRVEHPLWRQCNELGAAEALVENGVGQSDRLTVGLYEGDLLSHSVPIRTAGTRRTRIGERFWRRSQDRKESSEGLPGVCSPPYTPNITRRSCSATPTMQAWRNVSRRSRPGRRGARARAPASRRCESRAERASRWRSTRSARRRALAGPDTPAL